MALDPLGNTTKPDFNNAEKYLKKIEIKEEIYIKGTQGYFFNPNIGNSYADLRLTLASYHMAKLINNKVIKTKQDAASYIRENIKK